MERQQPLTPEEREAQIRRVTQENAELRRHLLPDFPKYAERLMDVGATDTLDKETEVED